MGCPWAGLGVGRGALRALSTSHGEYAQEITRDADFIIAIHGDFSIGNRLDDCVVG